MKKKYKLIKEYPGSPKIGEIIDLGEICWVGQTWLNDINKYSEFWKEFIQPDFQVLEISNPDGYIKKGKEIVYGYAYGAYPGYKIHSIKRLSDGEVFTVGDKISTSLSPKEIIKSFRELEKTSLRKGIWVDYEGGFVYLDAIKKLKQPLFKAEDGVEIFEGDKYSFVWVSSPAKGQCINTPYTRIAKKLSEGESWSESAKFFSTKEAAEEYIKMNKPEFSRNQVLELLENITGSKEVIINYHITNVSNGNKVK